MSEQMKLVDLMIQIGREITETQDSDPTEIQNKYKDDVNELSELIENVDHRNTDPVKGWIQGFAAVHYCAYYDLDVIFEVLFSISQDVIYQPTGSEATAQYGEMMLPISMSSSPLQIALTRRSSKIIAKYLDKINEDASFDKTLINKFLPYQNRVGATHLSLAALCSDCPQALALIENPEFVKAELPINATSESFFTVICTFGQMKPLTSLLKHLRDPALKELIYKTVLMNWSKPSYLDLCERDVDYQVFSTSRTQKQQLKKKMALLIQDALDFCANQTSQEYQILKNEWRKTVLYYYDEDDVQRTHGTKICLKDVAGAGADEVVQQAFAPYTAEDWFGGRNVLPNKIQYVCRTDARATDNGALIFRGFTLAFYCVLRQDFHTLQHVIAEEKDIVLAEETNLLLSQGNIRLRRGSSLLHMAILLNSPSMTEFLLKLGKKWNEECELSEVDASGKAGENAYEVAIQAKNQAAIVLLKHQSFYQQFTDDRFTANIIRKAFDEQNLDVLKTIVGLVNGGSLNQQIVIYRAILQIGVEGNDSAECKRIHRLLVRQARRYVVETGLFAHPEWEETVRAHYGAAYDDIIRETADKKAQQLAKLEEKTDQKFCLARDAVVSDRCYDTKYEEFQRTYYDEVQVFEEQLFRDRNVMDEEFRYEEMRAIHTAGGQGEGLENQDAPEGAEGIQETAKNPYQVIANGTGAAAGAENAEGNGNLENYEQIANQGSSGSGPLLSEEEKLQNLQEDITVMNMLINAGNETQLNAVSEILKDDIVAKIPQRLESWFSACQYMNLSLAESMHRSHLHAVDLRPTDPAAGIYNGFCGIHYAILNGHREIVQLLLDYELCDTTKARVLIDAPGIGAGKQVVLPIGTNCLQLAALCNQSDILAYLIEEVCARNTARFIDPIQQSFGRRPPLSIYDKLALLTMKNELDQNALCTLCMCGALLQANRPRIEGLVNQILLEFQSKQLDEGKNVPETYTGTKKEEDNNQNVKKQVLNNCENVISQRIDLAVKLCALYINAPLLRLIRQELVSNPVGRFSDENQAQMSFQIAQQVLEIKQQYPYLYQEDNFKDIQREVDSTMILIAATLHMKQKQNNQTWENQFSAVEQNEVFQQYKEQAIKNIELLQRPAYQTEFSGNFVRVPREIITPHYYYLDNVIQSPQLNCYFDAVINGDIEFVNLTYKEFAGKFDKRQTRGKIINGFTGLLYACYYSHYEIIKLLLQLEYNCNANQQVLISNGQFSYVFKQNVNFVQASILSNDQDLVQQLMTLARQQKLLHDVVFPPGQQTDIMKLAIFNKCGVIFQFGDLIQKELVNAQTVLEQDNRVESVLYSVSKERDAKSILQIKTLLVNYNDKETNDLLHAFYYSCLQRLDYVDEDAPIDPQTGEPQVLKMTSLDFLYSTVMKQLKQPETQQMYQSAIMFINQLTNSAILYAFEQVLAEEQAAAEGGEQGGLAAYNTVAGETAEGSEKKQSIAQSMLEQYYGEDYEAKKQYYKDNITAFQTSQWLYNKEESINRNYVVQLRQIASVDFEQYSNLQQMNVWFSMCSYGDVGSIKSLYKSCVRQKDQRINNYRDQIYTNFTGLMYSIINNNIQAFEVLVEDELDIGLDSEQVLYLEKNNEQVYYYLPENFMPLHLAALAGNQQFFNIMQKLYEQKGIYADQCSVSPSAMACVTDKDITENQLLIDFQTDMNLFRYAVQYARTGIIKKLARFGKRAEHKDTYYRQVFNKFKYNDEDLTVLDLITMLVPKERDITQEQIISTQNITKQIIANCLAEMIQNNVIDDYDELLEKFYDIEGVVKFIKEEYNQYTDPQILEDATAVKYSKISQENLRTTQQNYSFYEHTALEIQWFTSCRMNDVQFVKNNMKSFSNSVDRRQTTVQQKIHRGFTGLMYAIVYGALEVVDVLLEIEYETRLQCNTAIQIEQQYYYLPSLSNIFHVALLTNSQFLVEKIARKVRQTSPIWKETNQRQESAVTLMAGLGQCFRPLVDNFVSAFTKFEFLALLRVCVEVNNAALVRLLIQIGRRDRRVQELLYELSFEYARGQQGANQAEQLIIKQQDQAIRYALRQQAAGGPEASLWEQCLRNVYGGGTEQLRAEYDEFQAFSGGRIAAVSLEEIEEHFRLLDAADIQPPPALAELPKSRLSDDQLRWLDECKKPEGTCDFRFVQDNVRRFAGQLTDDRAVLDGEQSSYLGFTGLMYAVLNKNFTVFKLLLPFEMDIRVRQPTIIQLPTEAEKHYLLYPDDSIVNIAAITRNQDVCTWIIQQRDNKAYAHLFSELCTHECFMQQVLSKINFNEEVFTTYLSRETSQNIIEQLFLLGEQGERDEACIVRLAAFVRTYGPRDAFVQALFRLCLAAAGALGGRLVEKEPYAELYRSAAAYAVAQHRSGSWLNLLRLSLSEEDIAARVAAFRRARQGCDLVEEQRYAGLAARAFVVEDDAILLPEDDVRRGRAQGDGDQDVFYDEWFAACREGNLDYVQRCFSDCITLADRRPYAPSQDIFTGWTGIHYAAFFNHLDVVQFLFQHEYQCVTQHDCTIPAMGVGFGLKFMHSKGSTVLQTAILADNLQIVKFICQQIENDQKYLRTFLRPNLRGQSSIFTGCVAWRSRSGQLALNSKLVQLEMNFQKQQFEGLNALQAIYITNCAHFARDLFVRIMSDTQLKVNIYTIALTCDKLEIGLGGTDEERFYIEKFQEYLLRDAMNYCLSQKQTIQWNAVFEAYCKRCGVYGKALAIQYARTGTCEVIGNEIIVAEEFVEIAQGKLKPVQGSQGNGKGPAKLPGAGKLEMKQQISEDWDNLNTMLDNYENGLTGGQTE